MIYDTFLSGEERPVMIPRSKTAGHPGHNQGISLLLEENDRKLARFFRECPVIFPNISCPRPWSHSALQATVVSADAHLSIIEDPARSFPPYATATARWLVRHAQCKIMSRLDTD